MTSGLHEVDARQSESRLHKSEPIRNIKPISENFQDQDISELLDGRNQIEAIRNQYDLLREQVRMLDQNDPEGAWEFSKNNK